MQDGWQRSLSELLELAAMQNTSESGVQKEEEEEDEEVG